MTKTGQATTSRSTGRGGKSRGNNGGRGASRRSSRSNSSSIPTRTKFKGACEDLKDNVFDCSDNRQADKYITSVKHIAEHIGANYKHGGDIKACIEQETKITIAAPTEPTVADPTKPTPAERTQLKIFDRKLDLHVKRETILEDNIQRAYSLILGQCSDQLRTKLKQQTTWENVSATQDGIELIKLIKTVVFKFEDQKYLPLALVNAKGNLYSFRQGSLSNDDYLKRFNNLVDIAMSYDGQLYDQAILDFITEKKHPGVNYTALSNAQQQTVQDAAHEMYCATLFINGADRRRVGKLQEDLENNYTRGVDGYPTDMVMAFKMVNEFKNWQPRSAAVDASTTAFAQQGKSGKRNNNGDDDWKRNAKCHNCGEIGHIRPDCPKLKDEEDDSDDKSSDKTKKKKGDGASSKKSKSSQKRVTFASQHGESDADDDDDDSSGYGFCNYGHCGHTLVSPKAQKYDLHSLILLDNQSTVDLFCNRKLVTRLWTTTNSMTVHGNGGSLTTHTKAWLKNYGEVWFDERAITNILALKNVRGRGFPVSYNGEGDESLFTVHKPDGTQVLFPMHKDGLHYHDTKAKDVVFINTVKENQAGYSQRQIAAAKAARNLQSIVGHPSTNDLKTILQTNQIANCPISPADIVRAEKIYGPSVPILKGKTTRKTPDPVKSDYVAVPSQILAANKNVTIAGDIFFINKIPFFTTVSEHIKLTTTHYLSSRHTPKLVAAVKDVRSIYSTRGFAVKTAVMDGEFEKIKPDLREIGINLNTTAANEHVPQIERQIRVMKERCRATRHTLPFKIIPLLMLIELVYFSTFWINCFPPKGGVSDHLSPRNLMTGTQLDYQKHCQLPFGAYVQAHEEPSPSNGMQARTVGAICLGPTGNAQGSYKFLNLRTGKLIKRRKWTELPMPDEVIKRVNQLGKADGMPELLTFYDRKGEQIGDIVQTAHPGTPEEAIEPAEPDFERDPEPQTILEPQAPPPIQEEHEFQEPEPEDELPIVETVDDDDAQIPGVHHDPQDQVALDDDQDPGAAEPPEAHPAPPRRSSRERTKPIRLEPQLHGKSHADKAFVTYDSDDLIDNIHPQAHQDSHYALVTHHIMTQLSMQRGLKVWQNRAEDAITKELSQLHLRDTFEPVDPRTLSKEQRDQTIESHLFLKEKRDKKIKGRMVAGGNKQRDYIPKEEAASPTAYLESVFLTAVIDAKEERDVATIDVPNAFVQTRLKDDKDKAIMRLRGRLAELMVEVAPDVYGQYAFKDSKGTTILYVRLLNALYGIMKAAILYYKRFVKDIKSIGFEINPYDPCVANKVVNGTFLTLVWHVDDIKLSHKKAKTVTRMIDWLRETYERIFEDGTGAMTITRGKVHEYLGMTFDFSTRGEVKITMFDYVKEIVSQFAKFDSSVTKTALTPAAEHLFQINDDATPLPKDEATVYHNFVAKSLFLTKRARPDISTAVAFLTTRVKGPDVDDWKKLTRMIRYLRGTPELPLILRADGTSIIKWWADGSHAVHKDMKGQSGGCMSLGSGVPYSNSSKQKLNTRSSTESELVAADDVMPMLLWTNNFLKAQGYDSKGTVLYQDNQSAILLEKNGRLSSSKRTRHLSIRYFFITDRISNSELSVDYCPTGDMLADYFTKPLQGKLFLKFRKLILGIKDD